MTPNPAYSLDLDPSDYYLFLSIAYFLHLQCFINQKEEEKEFFTLKSEGVLYFERQKLESKNWQEGGFTHHIVWTEVNQIFTCSNPWLTSSTHEASATKRKGKLQWRSSSPWKIRTSNSAKSKNLQKDGFRWRNVGTWRLKPKYCKTLNFPQYIHVYL